MVTSRRKVVRESMPVLVAGAGPAGLTAAITLARNGIECLLVERRPALSGLPRADSVSTRTMELMRSWGLEDAIRAGGVDVEWKQWVGRTLAAAGAERPTSFPTREQSAVLSPTAPGRVPQDHIEPVLLEYLRTFPPPGCGWAPRSSASTRSRRRTGDPARHRVRETPGLTPATSSPPTARTAPSAPCSAWGWTGSGACPGRSAPSSGRRCGTCSATAATASTSSPTRRRAGCSSRPGAATDGSTASSRTSPTSRPASSPRSWRTPHPARQRAARPAAAHRPHRDLHFAAQLAERFRDGPVFLIGDAAHQITPRGGTGMNTAIQSAHDLGLEARLGAARLGRSPTCWTPTRPSAGRWPGTTWPARPTRTAGPGLPCRNYPPTSAAGSRTSGCPRCSACPHSTCSAPA